MPETEHPRVFYHGSRTPIHTLPEPFLDPKFATSYFVDCPQTPHVFVTPDRLTAKMCSLKVPGVVAISRTEDCGYIVFSRLPKELCGGWLYTCPENPERPFQQVIVCGQATGNWVSFDKVPVTKPEFVPGLSELAQQDGIQFYVLKEGIDPKMWSDTCWSAIMRTAGGRGQDFIHEQVMVGNLRHLNID